MTWMRGSAMIVRMNSLSAWIADAWSRHADAPQAVADELPSHFAAAANDAEVAALAHLTQHVFGAHLGAWARGQELLMALAHGAGQRGVLAPNGKAEGDIARCVAAFALAKGGPDRRAQLEPEERIRVTALAASSLVDHDAARAGTLLDEALALADAATLKEGSPAWRALAVAGNGIAAGLEEHAERSEPQRALMLAAAQVARTYWEKAGTWLEVERAEYRLAHSWLKAGGPDAADRARRHAQECLRIVEANQAPALERFFGLEPLVLAERAASRHDAAAAALRRMEEAFTGLSADDQGWCRASLEKLGGRS